MKKLILVTVMAFPIYLYAGMDMDKNHKVTGEEVVKAIDSESSVTDDAKEVAAKALTVKKDLDDAKKSGNKEARLMIIAGGLAAIFKLLLSLLKILSKNIGWFKTKEGKRIVKYSTLGLGALAGIAANMGFGMSIVESIMIAGSGPLSVAIHEYTKDSKEPSSKKSKKSSKKSSKKVSGKKDKKK